MSRYHPMITDLGKYTPAELPTHATARDTHTHPIIPAGRPPLTREQRRLKFPRAYRDGIIS